MIRKFRLIPVSFIALLGGILTSLAYISSPSGVIKLSDLVLCLSGNRPGVSMLDLLSLSSLYFPLYIFCAISGTNLYRHFCTASVYIFSRQPNRLKWYMRELFSLSMAAFIYQSVFLVASFWTTQANLKIEFEWSGMILLVFHFVIQFLWTYSLSLIINMFSIWLGSDLGYAFGIGLNMLLITLLTVPGLLEINPASRLVFGWHRSENTLLGSVLNNSEHALSINVSLSYMMVLTLTLAIFVGIVVNRHDLLISNKETGGV